MRRIGIGVILIVMVFALAGCQSSYSVTRLASDRDLDLSGNWNDTDIRQVSEALVSSSNNLG